MAKICIYFDNIHLLRKISKNQNIRYVSDSMDGPVVGAETSCLSCVIVSYWLTITKIIAIIESVVFNSFYNILDFSVVNYNSNK